jgi:hypothetical protein
MQSTVSVAGALVTAPTVVGLTWFGDQAIAGVRSIWDGYGHDSLGGHLLRMADESGKATFMYDVMPALFMRPNPALFSAGASSGSSTVRTIVNGADNVAVPTPMVSHSAPVVGGNFTPIVSEPVMSSALPFAGLTRPQLRNILRSWDAGTRRSRAASIRYHFDKHGKGRTLLEYTAEAQNLFNANAGAAIWGKWKTTWEPSFRVIADGFKGYFTEVGKVLTYFKQFGKGG